MSKLTELVDLVQDAVNKGASSVEEIHKTIAKQPLEMLKNISPIKEKVEEYEGLRNQTIGSIYEAIRSVNESVTEMAKDALEKVEKVTKKQTKEDITQ